MKDLTEIQSAVRYMKRMYKRIIKIEPSITHRNGTVYYCFTESWIQDVHQKKIFLRIMYKVVNYYPDIAVGIVDRYIDEIPTDQVSSSPEFCWIAGYFQRIIDEGVDENE